MNCPKCSAVMVWKGSLTRGALVCEICEAEKPKPETVKVLSDSELKIGDVVYVADGHGSNTPTMQEQQDEYMDKLGAYPDDNADGGYMAKCRACGEYKPIYCDPGDFDPDSHYCGGSPQCCP